MYFHWHCYQYFSEFIYSFQYLNIICPEVYNVILSKVISSTALASNWPNILNNKRFFGNYGNNTSEKFKSVNFSAKLWEKLLLCFFCHFAVRYLVLKNCYQVKSVNVRLLKPYQWKCRLKRIKHLWNSIVCVRLSWVISTFPQIWEHLMYNFKMLMWYKI